VLFSCSHNYYKEIGNIDFQVRTAFDVFYLIFGYNMETIHQLETAAVVVFCGRTVVRSILCTNILHIWLNCNHISRQSKCLGKAGWSPLCNHVRAAMYLLGTVDNSSCIADQDAPRLM
jgi:hypothetical protein